MTLGDRIRARLLELEMSESELARLSGVSQPTINDLVNNQQKTTRFLPEIAAALRMHPGDLDPKFKSQSAHLPEEAAKLLVYAAAEGGPGELVVSTDPIDKVRRPWFLGEVADAYAVIVTGESMVPAYRPGDMVIVNPRLAPMRHKHHILISEGVDGGFRASIKLVTGWSAAEWKLEQYNPPAGQAREFTLPKAKWPRALRIVARIEAA